MTNIPDTEYITVKRDEKGDVGVFVGGKPATTYRGEKIDYIEYIKEVFAWMQEQNPDITEFHIMSSETNGEHAKSGEPSSKTGNNSWCRVVTRDITPVSWVLILKRQSANVGAFLCAYAVRTFANFRSALFGLIDNQGTKQKQPSVIKLPWQITTIARRDKQK